MNNITFKIKVAKPKIQKVTSYVTRVCKTCGKEFKIPIWYGKGEYCSKNCANLGRIVKTVTAVVKREELLGSPEEDNQQPSTPLTKCEGSETNS